MRTVGFPAQGELDACLMDFPYSEGSETYTIFCTPQGYVSAKGIGNVLTGIPGEVKVLEITFNGQVEYMLGYSAVKKVTVTDAPNGEVLDVVKDKKKAEIASARYKQEIAGVEVAGMTVKTDRESQGLITGAALQAFVDPTYTCRWKTADTFIELTAEQIQGVAMTVRLHVQGAFDKEACLSGLIEACTTPEEVAQITWAI